MKLIKTIDLNNLPEAERSAYRFRQSARAVVFDAQNNIALIYNGKYSYHKLPGGGVEEGEDIETALRRECREEIGCEIEITGEVGRIIEYRDEFVQKHESFCFTARISGEKCEPKFTADKLKNNFSFEWVTLDEAIEIIIKESPVDHLGKYIVKRDLTFLQACRANLGRDEAPSHLE